VVGYDVDSRKIQSLKSGVDLNGEVHDVDIVSSSLYLTDDATELLDADIFIITVPTPVDDNNCPDLSILRSATKIVSRCVSTDNVVIYESTVYPGVTEEICLPLLEQGSGLRAGRDFKIGYSPERINPGDQVHTLENTVKVVSGMDEATLEQVASLYETIITAGVHRASTIKVAEAAKVIENTQRDLNIALMNELAILFNKMDIDTTSVLEAAGTKWNFLKFVPGLVGGHCIGVDPYYLTYKSEELGYKPQVILSGRRINDSMGKYIAEQTVKKMIQAGKPVRGSRVLVLGLAFKENVSDLRNSKVVDVVTELQEYGVEALVCDPVVDADAARHEYGLELVPLDMSQGYDAVVLAVAHEPFRRLDAEQLQALCCSSSGPAVLIDVKGLFRSAVEDLEGLSYWCL
jgi:UDP-N-acetyl-D-galactosamine dehydrogenase